MERLRLNGPRSPVQRFIMRVLAGFDKTGHDWVFGGTLEDDTGYSDRAIRENLRQLVIAGHLEPECGPSDTLPLPRNQYGTITRKRVHSHLGGCRPGTHEGEKTRYRIIYRDHPPVEAPRTGRRKAKKGERGSPIEGGMGLRTDGGDTPLHDQRRGNGAPRRGNGAPNKGEPASPDREEKEIDRDAGGTPPYPPEGGEPVAPYGAPEPPLAANAALGPAAAPLVAIQDTLAQEGKALRLVWDAVVRQIQIDQPEDMGVRLWLSRRVQPMHLADGVLHLTCPSPRYAANIYDRYAPALCALLSTRVAPVASIVCHPQEAAA